MIVVDSSVWVNHFRAVDPALVELLSQSRVVTHPFVLGELACGNLRRRAQTLADLRKLPSITVTSDKDVYHLVESQRLWGRGLGWVDMHLLTSTLISGHQLWTHDQALRSVAERLKVAW